MNQALIHVFLPIIAAIIINIIIYSNKWNDNNINNNNNDLLPPGYIIAIVWIIILGLLGYVHYKVYPSYTSYIIIIAIIYCLSYPFLTNDLKQTNAKLLNFISLIIAMIVSISVYMIDKNSVYLTVPFLLWTSYVNIVTNKNIDAN